MAPKPFNADAQDAEQFLGKRGVLRYWMNPQGNRIATYFWPSEKPAKAIIVAAHGHGAYLPYEYLNSQGPGEPNIYQGSWVERLNAAGYSVVGCDNQGAGRSEGLRCYTASFDEYVADVRHIAMPLVNFVSNNMPWLPCAKTEKNYKFPDLQLMFESDPYNYNGATRARNAAEYLRVTSWFMQNVEAVDFPFLVVHSEHDTMCDCDGSKALYLRSASVDKTLRLVNTMWHLLTKEPGAMDLLENTVLPWFDKRTSVAEA
eukprot:gene10167-8072_t